MRRRDFCLLLSGVAAAWPTDAFAEQPAMPVIGFLGAGSFEGSAERLRAFRLGLKDNGYIDGENVAMEYRWTENQPDQLAELATDLVRRQVSVIVTSGGPSSATAAKSATVTTPIVFIVNEDPVKLGLVTSLARPSGNLTGVNIFLSELAAKRLELLRELLPAAARVIVLVNPSNAVITESTLRDVDVAARGLGLQIQVVQASSAPEINSAFAAFSRERPDALFVSGDPFFLDRRVQIANLASHYSIPVASGVRGIAEAGGLMSYGASLSDAYRQVGVYTGRILKGAKTADLPVLQSSKFELIINAETARMLGIAIPPAMLARADEVIE